MRQAEGLTSHHVPVRKDRGVRYCNNETVSDMALERPQKPAERACCAGYLESWEGRYARQRASGGASGAWIGQGRKRKGLRPGDESHLALQYQYIRREMGKASPKIFSQNQFPDFRWASPFFPPRNFWKCRATPLSRPYYSRTTWVTGPIRGMMSSHD